jgi:tetratricopeptide (TPR) repeat protein
MMHVDAIKNVPDHVRDVEFKEVFENDGVARSLAKAQEIIDKAEGDGTLTATQILVARINLILDNASEEQLKQQDVLLAQFMRSQPAEYIGFLGESMLDTHNYRPARVLLKHYLLTDPHNVAVRQNLGYASFNLGIWDEAEAAADLVLTNPQALSAEALRIAYYQKALGAMNRGDYNTSMTFAEKGFALSDGHFELLTIQLIAAMTGNVEKLQTALKLYEEDMKEQTESYQLKRASVEALALAMNGQTEQARAVVARWSHKDRVPGRIKDYWRHFPVRDKVVENWISLATPQN